MRFHILAAELRYALAIVKEHNLDDQRTSMARHTLDQHLTHLEKPQLSGEIPNGNVGGESVLALFLAAKAAPVMIWMTDIDTLCVYVNEGWLRFTGRSFETQLGNGWMEAIYPDDRNTLKSMYVDACERRETWQLTYRVCRHDGVYRWILDTGVPRFDEEGQFAGYVGSCIDVTERKLAEDALEDLERRVLSAQEEERARIARELHDDINQRISILCWELRDLDREPLGEEKSRRSLEKLTERLQKVGADIQAISHRLHSSHLEYLGLEIAAEVLCRELRTKHHVDLAFVSEGVPRELPEDVSLCLYRVLQEALQNAIKYSGAQRYKVELVGDSTEVRLTVTDQGVGFDLAAQTRPGLGLISMRERMRLVRGDFQVQSVPGLGTTIRCKVKITNQAIHANLV